MPVVNDNAIKSKQDDLLGRAVFASNIASLIIKRTDSESFYIGVMGAWGSGKTSVLNLIDEEFRSFNEKCSFPKVLSLTFNPWRYSGEDELLMYFFNEIASALDTQLQTKGELVKSFFKSHTEKLGSLISVASGDPTNTGQKIASWLSGFLKSSNLLDFKKRVQTLLEERKSKLVIYVDDIDRLSKNEIQELFKVIKILGDFENIIYILCFDKDVVVNALNESYSSTKSQTFLEKIIQLQVEIPLINKVILEKIWQESIERVLAENDIVLSNSEWNELSQYISDGFLLNLNDIRKIKNIENSLSYIIPILSKHVYLVDLIVIESIRFFYPKVYDVLKYRKFDIFNSRKDFSRSLALMAGEIQEQDIINSNLDDFLKATDLKSIPNCNLILKMLKNLLPSLKVKLEKNSYSSIKKNKDLKICHEDYYDRYFSYTLNPGEMPEYEIVELFNDSNNFVLNFKKLLNGFEQSEIINKIYIYLINSEEIKIERYLSLLIPMCTFIKDENVEVGFFKGSNVDLYIYKIVSLIHEKQIDCHFFVKNNIFYSFNNKTFVSFFYQFSEFYDLINDQELCMFFSKEAFSRISRGLNILDFPEDFYISKLLNLLKKNENFHITEYLDRILNNKDDLKVFLEAFCPVSIPGGRKIEIDKEIYKFIDILVGGVYIFEKINKFYADKILISELDKKSDVIDHYLFRFNNAKK